jgi:hypothetical protein
MNRKPTPSILEDVLSAATAPTLLSIDQIKIDGGTQMRAMLNEETVREYLAEMQPIGWSQFPPIVAYYDGSEYWLADGFHRLEAYRRAAAEVEQPADQIPADVRAGTRREAILYAAGANAQHGLRRTNADKRRAVETLLRDDEWRQWSDRVIGHACAVDPSFVGRVRRSLTVDGLQSTARTGADGRTINTANIGTPRTYASGLPKLEIPLKPAPVQPTPITVDGARPLPDWAAADDAADAPLTPEIMATLKPMPASVLTDKEQAMIRPLLVTERRARLAALETRFDQTLKALPEWCELTGRHTATGEAERGLRRLLQLTQRELAILRGQPVEAWGEDWND